MPTKKCSKCKEIKLKSEFHKRAKNPDGLKCQCKSCHSKYNKQRYKANSEKMKKQAKQYREANLEKCRKRTRRWREMNPQKVKEGNKQNHKKCNFESEKRYKEAMNKYDGWCAFGCGREAELVHHKDGKNDRKSEPEEVNNDLSNLLPLCKSCHSSLHAIINYKMRKQKNEL